MNKIKLLALLGLLASCSTPKTITGEKAFYGTIVYDVIIEGGKENQTRMDVAHGEFGDELTLSIFKNGDILSNYSGNDNRIDLMYLDLEQRQYLTKYNGSDTLYYTPLATGNMVKLSDVREDKKLKESIAGYDCQLNGYYVENVKRNSAYMRYMTLSYWYSNDLVVDQRRYKGVEEDLLGFLFSEADGAIFLKKELNYYSFKVTLKAREVLPGELPDVRWMRKAVRLPL